MKKGIFSLVIVCIGFMITSCGTTKRAASTSISLTGEWNIVKVDGKMLSPVNGNSSLPTIGFDAQAHRVYGNSGCNRMMGSYATEPGKPESLSFGAMGSTRMACPDMSTEQSILNALAKVKSFKVVSCKRDQEGSCKVALCDEKGKEIAVIEKVPAGVMALKGMWSISEVNGKPIGKSEKDVFIGFDVEKNHVYGCAGCNNINGAFEYDAKNPSDIKLGPIAATMMACADMDTETAVLRALNTVKSFKIIGETKVGLCDAEGNQVLTLFKKMIVDKN